MLSPAAYNARTGLALCCPITSQTKGYPFEVALPAGLKIQGAVLSDHIKSLDWRVRRLKHADRAPAAVVTEALEKLSALLT